MVTSTKNLCQFISKSLKANSNRQKAKEMAAYMRTDMPFYGVQKPNRIPIIKEAKKTFAPDNQKNYEQMVLACWALPHREEKYIAIDLAKAFPEFINRASIDLYEQLIREGAWWDFVDDIAISLIGQVLLLERKILSPIIETWVQDDDRWIRRTSLIAHIYHKKATDEKQLFRLCKKLAPEKEFFIRKAVGWALREYSKTSPSTVKKFLAEHKSLLSPLSYKEGAKHLVSKGLLDD